MAIPVLDSHKKVQVVLICERRSRVACKTLPSYVDGQFMVSIQFCTDHISVSHPRKVLVVECLRRYITNVMTETDGEIPSSFAAVYATLSVPDYSVNGTGSLSEETTASFIASSG